jgi:hypothetical protein
MPEALEQPVRYHHDPDACATHKGQATVIYVANRLAHRYGFGCSADSATCSRTRSARGSVSTNRGSVISTGGLPDCSKSRDQSSPNGAPRQALGNALGKGLGQSPRPGAPLVH